VGASASAAQKVAQAGEEARGVEANAGAAVRTRRRWSAAARRWCGRTNLNYTGSSTRVHPRGLQRASNGIILWPVG
jgi:hypothetical protein